MNLLLDKKTQMNLIGCKTNKNKSIKIKKNKNSFLFIYTNSRETSMVKDDTIDYGLADACQDILNNIKEQYGTLSNPKQVEKSFTTTGWVFRVNNGQKGNSIQWGFGIPSWKEHNTFLADKRKKKDGKYVPNLDEIYGCWKHPIHILNYLRFVEQLSSTDPCCLRVQSFYNMDKELYDIIFSDDYENEYGEMLKNGGKRRKAIKNTKASILATVDSYSHTKPTIDFKVDSTGTVCANFKGIYRNGCIYVSKASDAVLEKFHQTGLVYCSMLEDKDAIGENKNVEGYIATIYESSQKKSQNRKDHPNENFLAVVEENKNRKRLRIEQEQQSVKKVAIDGDKKNSTSIKKKTTKISNKK